MNEETNRLSKVISFSDTIDECVDLLANSIILDIGIPVKYGGDPGPAGTASIIQTTLAEGLSNNLPAARLFAHHSASVDLILKYGSDKQKELVCLDAVAGILTPFATKGEIELENGQINGSLMVPGAYLDKVSNFIAKLKHGDEECFIIIKKLDHDIIIEDQYDEFGNVRVFLDNLTFCESMKKGIYFFNVLVLCFCEIFHIPFTDFAGEIFRTSTVFRRFVQSNDVRQS